jgi:type IV pilus assembly protein PilY1
MKEFTKKKLVSALSLLMTGLVSTSVSNASDISIYRAAEKGTITLMFLLDNSGSMGSADGTGVTRLERVRSGMIDVLAGGNGAAALSNDKIIGLSSFYNSSSGYVLVPARALNTVISGGGSYTAKKPIYKYYNNGSKNVYSSCTAWSTYNTCTEWGEEKTAKPSGSYSSESCTNVNNKACTLYYTTVTVNVTDQRTLLLKEMSTWTGNYSTPTGEAYAEVGAYMLGTTTKSWYSCGSSGNSSTSRCTVSLTGAPSLAGYTKESSGNDIYYYSGTGSAKKYYFKFGTPSGSGFPYSVNTSKNAEEISYVSPISETNTQCSGQGIYLLTDGEPNGAADSVSKTLMQNALTSSYGSAVTCSGTLFDGTGARYSGNSWNCISDFSQLLLNRTVKGDASTSKMNPKNLVIKTAVVGFGSDFNGLTSYNSALTQAQNLANINTASASADVKNAARWGIYGQGGWYSGSSSADVVSSVNSFISALATDIPSVTTGESYIPSDQLNPAAVQNFTYSSQFQPTPDATYQLWAGNLKKYKVVDGLIKDVKGNSLTNSSGKIEDNYDYWSETILAGASNSAALKLIGGVKANLPLGMAAGNAANRKLLINRDVNGTATATALNQIGASYVTNTTDSSRGYLLSLLGYIIADPANPPNTIAGLTAASSLRQLGAVMHSSPILLTQSGVIGSTNGAVTTSDRDDYTLFGTTQGVLSVVNASTGIEKFAFVPNEMVSTQKKAFLENTTTSGFSTSTYQPFYYGIDAPWTSYSEYVLKSDKTKMTVGTGVGTSSGVQMAYGGLRMGGRSYYALNLQNMDAPSLAFRIDPNTQAVYRGNSSTAYKELAFMGQSWSKPTIGFVKWNGKKTRVMIVGGGYDAGGTNGDGAFDSTTGERTGFSGYESSDYVQSNKRGAGVYMFNAETGALLWWSGANATSANTTDGVGYSTVSNLQYSVVSQIRSVDRNADGLIDHLYFGDLGGQLWRVDLNNSMATFDKNSFAKPPQRLLTLNNGLYSPRFYEMPAFSTYSSSGNTFGVVSIGSGNRSLPRFNSSSASYKNDAVYNIYDKDVARSDLFKMDGAVYKVCETLNTSSTTADKSCRADALITKNLVLANLGQVTSNDNKTAVASYESTGGWYHYFASTLTQDAKVLSTPIVLDNDLYVTTFDGSKAGLSGDCGAGVKGESFVYQFCMPYGVCTDAQISASTFLKGKSLGAGIISPAVGSSNTAGSNRVLVSGNGALAGGQSKTYSTPLSLVPVRWYETSK